ncbi:MAG: primosomal protein N' [Candidatus Caldatribacteriota bacterium]|nr:primosomal protein N' [Candidatus Caldatribacteriota bacterium]
MALTNIYSEKNFAEIILLKFSINKIFHYSIPVNFKETISIGTRVLVPFKDTLKTGCVVGFLTKSNIKNCKDISQIIDKNPLLTSNLVKLTKWISDYYICPWSRALNYALPKTKKLWIKNLEKKGLQSTIHHLTETTILHDKKPSLLENEEVAFQKVEKAISDKKFQLYFLGFVNFNQKVKIYSKCIQNSLSIGKQVIILTPTEFTMSELAKCLKKEYKDKILVFDDKINQKNKFFQWINMENSITSVVLGMRSTIFAPFNKLGLIIVDQEHNSLYKEERSPRYNAREVAIKRAKLENVPIILNSESPSLETYKGMIKKDIKKINFPRENSDKKLLKTTVIDMTREKSKKKIISYELQQTISKNIKNNKQVILFLNKRGFSSFVICNKCGYIPKCTDCNNPLSYHFNYRKVPQLICHSCGKRVKMLDTCPECGSKELRPLGIGTQRVESEIRKMFPRTKIKRLDQDVIIKKGDYKQIIGDFNRGEIDILIGTKMATKRVNYKNVGLIGIISADTLLNLPDYRSSENTFQLIKEITSFIREKEILKEVIIQTFNPEHHCIIALKEEDYNLFYQNEMKLRKELNYPPFTHIIKIEIKGEEKQKVEQNAKILLDYLDEICKTKEMPKFTLLGSKDMVIWKNKNIFKIQFLIKIKNIEKFNKIFMKKFDRIVSSHFDSKNRLIIDVDPIKMI